MAFWVSKHCLQLTWQLIQFTFHNNAWLWTISFWSVYTVHLSSNGGISVFIPRLKINWLTTQSRMWVGWRKIRVLIQFWIYYWRSSEQIDSTIDYNTFGWRKLVNRGISSWESFCHGMKKESACAFLFSNTVNRKRDNRHDTDSPHMESHVLKWNIIINFRRLFNF